MNILYQCSEYPPFKNGGIGSVTKIVAEEMAKRGHNVYIVGYYSNLDARIKEENINGVRVFRLNYGIRKGKLRYQLFRLLNYLRIAGPFIQQEVTWFEKQVENLIVKYEIDLYELTDYYPFNHYNVKLKFLRFSTPTILRVHGSASFLRHYKGKDKDYIVQNDKNHFERASWLCPVSNFASQYIKENFPCDHFIGERVIYNPIEMSFLSTTKPSSSKNILYIGKLIRTKGAYAIIEAFNQLLSEYPDWNLRLIGMGDIEAIKKSVPYESYDNIVFLGFCNRYTIAKEIDDCAFACIPTFFENFSMVPLEIMGRCRAIIYTNRTSGGEIVENGIDGYTVNPEDIDDICDKIKKLIEDEKLRQIFAQRGYDKVKRYFSTAAIVSEYENFYREVINSYNV